MDKMRISIVPVAPKIKIEKYNFPHIKMGEIILSCIIMRSRSSPIIVERREYQMGEMIFFIFGAIRTIPIQKPEVGDNGPMSVF